MEAKQIYLFPLIMFFLLSTLSLQAISSPITEINNDFIEKKRAAFRELEKVVGRPNFTASDHTEWMLRAAGFILERIDWKYNFSGEEKPDAKAYARARGKAYHVVDWLVNFKPLNPYRPYSSWNFFYTFGDIRYLEHESPVYACYKAMWPTCVGRAPATPEGEVVYLFQCAWEFNKKCRPWYPLGSQT